MSDSTAGDTPAPGPAVTGTASTNVEAVTVTTEPTAPTDNTTAPAAPDEAHSLLEAVTSALSSFREQVLAPLVQKVDDLVARVASLEQAPAPAADTAPTGGPAQLLDEQAAEAELDAALGVSATNPNPPSV